MLLSKVIFFFEYLYQNLPSRSTCTYYISSYKTYYIYIINEHLID